MKFYARKATLVVFMFGATTNASCVDKIQSACANEIIGTATGADVVKGLLSQCGLQYSRLARIDRGWFPVFNFFTVANAVSKESFVCFDGDTAKTQLLTDAGWIPEGIVDYDPYEIVNDNTTLRITAIPNLMYNTLSHVGNGVFKYERDRGVDVKLTVVGIPADVEDVPACVYQEDEDDGSFLWQELFLTPTKTLDPLLLFKESLSSVLRFLSFLGLNSFFFEDGFTCNP